MQNNPRVYAGFFVRLSAWILDSLLLLLLLLPVRIAVRILGWSASFRFLSERIFFRFTPAHILIYLLAVAYFIFMTYFTGATVGKKLLKLRVVSVEDRKPSMYEIVFRETVGRFLSTAILNIGYLMIGAGDQKQALHDYLADTRVVYAWDGEVKQEDMADVVKGDEPEVH